MIEAQGDKAAPDVFVRSFSVPPGAPWDQARSAALEARLGAPLPPDQLLWRLRRLERGWAPARAARYAAIYVRKADVGSGLKKTVRIDGQAFEVVFASRRHQMAHARSYGLAALVVAAGIALAGVAVTTALTQRTSLESHLAATEQAAATRLREARAQAALAREARLLEGIGASDQTMETIVADLAWASQHKTKEAHIDALHWEHGYMGVEVRGSTAPFTTPDRTVMKAKEPIRPGIWLWGVGPSPSPADHRP